MSSRGQRRTAVENADIVETQKPALEDVLALGVLSVHPPREIQHQLVEDTLEKLAITGTLPLLLDLVYPPRGPRVNGRIHITKCPLIGGNLAVRMHVPLAQQEDELLLRKVAIDESKRNAMEGEIPRGVPRVFPFIRH